MRYTSEEKVHSMITKIEVDLEALKVLINKALQSPKEISIKVKTKKKNIKIKSKSKK